ncbi:hypothetical protein PLANTIT3_61278 [Plantibacter sp. T3]|nr:hypothetical protein PLANTIT3_61278 [Plantibacter sp. T3]
MATRCRGGDRHDVRRRAVPPRRPAVGRGRRPPPSRPGAPQPADRLSGGPLEHPARDDAARQEDARFDVAVHRARRPRQADRPPGARDLAALRRLPGDRLLTDAGALRERSSRTDTLDS